MKKALVHEYRLNISTKQLHNDRNSHKCIQRSTLIEIFIK